MPLPKRRHSNQRTRKRRTHYKLSHHPAIIPSMEARTGFALLHHVDLGTGRYRGRQVFDVADENPADGA
ncbi:MAG: 50S ribosomal protein L32 [Armatimonadetes bacterium]|nr:50S ribosomal protein L32 [Armatimonadota bacterium]MDE2205082.1 50S ribosomal protein L32 [Armatimonadota bacterium]